MGKSDKAFREACKHFFDENWDKPLDKENKKRKSEKFDFEQALVDVGVNDEVARDWMAVRKQKKAANTRTAFNLLLGQLEIIRNKYKVTNNDIIMVCVCRCWMGCRASFFDNINFADYGIETAVQNNNLPNINQNIPNYGRTRHQEAFVRTFTEEDQQNQVF